MNNIERDKLFNENRRLLDELRSRTRLLLIGNKNIKTVADEETKLGIKTETAIDDFIHR